MANTPNLSTFLKAEKSCPFLNGTTEINIEDIKNLPCAKCKIDDCTLQKINPKQVDAVVKKSVDLINECYNTVKQAPAIFSKCIEEYTELLKNSLDSKGVNYRLDDDLRRYNRLRWSWFDFYGNIANDENVFIAQISTHSLLEYIVIHHLAPKGIEPDSGAAKASLPIIYASIEEYSGKLPWDGYDTYKPYAPLIKMVEKRVGQEIDKEGLEYSEFGIAFPTNINPEILNWVFKFENPSNELKTAFGRAVRADDCNITMDGDMLVVPLIDILFYKHTNTVPAMFNKAFGIKLPKFSVMLKKNKLIRIIPV